MNDLVSAVPLLLKWEEFIRAEKRGDLEKFARWLAEDIKSTTKAKSGPPVGFFADRLIPKLNLNGAYPAIPSHSGLAGYMVSRLYKALRFYLKPITQQHGLNSIDELFFLSNLAWKKGISKKALCQLAMTDFPTGVDIIKRLKKNGWVLEEVNEADKREKLLNLTPQGHKKVIEVYIDVAKIQDVLADLQDDDRLVIINLLDRLNCFHTKIYEAQT